MQQPVSACSAHSRELTSLSRYSRSSCPKSRHRLRRCLCDILIAALMSLTVNASHGPFAGIAAAAGRSLGYSLSPAWVDRMSLCLSPLPSSGLRTVSDCSTCYRSLTSW